jgi:type IV pilus assembly protein PilX
MHNIKYLANNEKGSVIVAAIMILALLTIIGIAATNMSTTEQHLAVNTLLYERAFYAAEAGFEHAKGVLKVPYTVTVWNNDDRATGGTPTTDTDGKIMVRTVARGPRGSICAIESLIEGTTDSGGMEGYKAQAGAGAGKSYRNNDLESITDFTQQM